MIPFTTPGEVTSPKVTKQVTFVDFVGVYGNHFNETLDKTRGDDIKVTDATISILYPSKEQVVVVERQNLLYWSCRDATVEVTAPKPGAADAKS